MKRKLFIGSSSEGLDIATKLKNKVDLECGDWIISEIWNERSVFSLNKSALDSLIRASRKFDYGVLIATKDDIVKSRGLWKPIPRDNVMLEIGMFLGSLGLTRAFLMVEEGSKLPTDYLGITVPFFKRGIPSSLDTAINQIIETFNTTKSSYNLKPLPSVALALGYFDNFILPLAKRRLKENINFKLEILLPKNIWQINDERLDYLNKNESTEKSVYGDGKRPLVFELNSTSHHYWDIPTTLTTLSKLMDLLLPSSEVGINREKEDWIDHELRNFAGTITTLAEQFPSCRDKVKVLRLS